MLLTGSEESFQAGRKTEGRIVIIFFRINHHGRDEIF